MHPLINWRYFVTLLVSQFEKELRVCPKQERFVINVILHAKDIPNNCVIFLEDDCGCAIVTFLKHQDVNYKV